MRLPWKRREEAPAAQRPDYTAIAVMEHDLFGIQPEPGTTAAAVIAMRHFGTHLAHPPVAAWASPVYVGPEYGSGLVSRPSPFLLEAGERLRRPCR